MKVLFNIITASVLVVVCGCAGPKVTHVSPVVKNGTYDYSQGPQKETLQYGGSDYKEHLKQMQAMALAHEETLAASEYRTKEAIAEVRLRKEAADNGVTLSPVLQAAQFVPNQQVVVITNYVVANSAQPTHNFVGQSQVVYAQPTTTTTVVQPVYPAYTYPAYSGYSYGYSSPYVYGYPYGYRYSRYYWPSIQIGVGYRGYVGVGYRGSNYRGYGHHR